MTRKIKTFLSPVRPFDELWGIPCPVDNMGVPAGSQQHSVKRRDWRNGEAKNQVPRTARGQNTDDDEEKLILHKRETNSSEMSLIVFLFIVVSKHLYTIK